jgi:hypothetical protein
MSKDLPAIQKAYDLAKELLTRAAKYPRDYKFTLGERIVTHMLHILELLIEAAYSRDKIRCLDEANRTLEKLRVLLRLSHELGPLSTKGYEYVMAMAKDLGNQIGGWRKQAEARDGQNVQAPLS